MESESSRPSGSRDTDGPHHRNPLAQRDRRLEGRSPPNQFERLVATWGKVGLVLQVLAYLDDCFVLPKVPEAT